MLSRTTAAAALLLAAATVILAQAPAKKAEPAPKPAVAESEEALAAWNEVGRRLIAMAEDMAEAKYAYQPNQDTRTFAAILLHVAGSNYYYTNAVTGREVAKAEDDPPQEKYKTKAQVVAFLKKSYADGAALIKGVSREKWEKPIQHPWRNEMIHPHSLWSEGVGHGSEHYGNLVTYYRIHGLVPPESRPKK